MKQRREKQRKSIKPKASSLKRPRKISDKQSNFTPKGTRERRTNKTQN